MSPADYTELDRTCFLAHSVSTRIIKDGFAECRTHCLVFYTVGLLTEAVTRHQKKSSKGLTPVALTGLTARPAPSLRSSCPNRRSKALLMPRLWYLLGDPALKGWAAILQGTADALNQTPSRGAVCSRATAHGPGSGAPEYFLSP